MFKHINKDIWKISKKVSIYERIFKYLQIINSAKTLLKITASNIDKTTKSILPIKKTEIIESVVLKISATILQNSNKETLLYTLYIVLNNNCCLPSNIQRGSKNII